MIFSTVILVVAMWLSEHQPSRPHVRQKRGRAEKVQRAQALSQKSRAFVYHGPRLSLQEPREHSFVLC